MVRVTRTKAEGIAAGGIFICPSGGFRQHSWLIKILFWRNPTLSCCLHLKTVIALNSLLWVHKLCGSFLQQGFTVNVFILGEYSVKTLLGQRSVCCEKPAGTATFRFLPSLWKYLVGIEKSDEVVWSILERLGVFLIVLMSLISLLYLVATFWLCYQNNLSILPG